MESINIFLVILIGLISYFLWETRESFFWHVHPEIRYYEKEGNKVHRYVHDGYRGEVKDTISLEGC